MNRLFGIALSLMASGCAEDTGSGLVQFEALAGGSLHAQSDAAYEFDSGAGYHISLTRAELRIGAVYLNRARPILGAQDTACVLPGLYAAEVRTGASINALSSDLVPFDGRGHGTADRALTGEVWFTGGNIDGTNDSTHVLEYRGTALRDSRRYGFYGTITISANRSIASADPATPGANPLCKQRIVTPIPIDITPEQGGQLVLRVSPEIWFDQVDFAKLPGAVGAGEDLEIVDSNADPVSVTLFQGLRATSGYRFEWMNGS